MTPILAPSNKLFVFTAPSGSGKTTVVRHLLGKFPELVFSVSATNRPKREHERMGRDYYFLSNTTFQMWIEAEAFVEWEEVYEDQFYGTPRFEIERVWALGKNVIFDIDVKGAMNIKKMYPNEAVVVFIQVPDIQTLIDRLMARKTETEESLKKRIEKVKEEMAYAPGCDYILINGELDNTLKEAEKIVMQYL